MNAAWESLFEGSLTLSLQQRTVDALAELPARRGVLLFTDEHNQPIQLVQTANIRMLSRSRLGQSQEDIPHRKADLAAVTRRLFYACCWNEFERHLLYQRLAHEVFGRQWKKWLALPRREYAAIDLHRLFPFFYLTGDVTTRSSVDLYGPFANRRSAAQFCESLNVAFELCRNSALLDGGHPESCPYLQMQTCHGLCCQANGPSAYALQVKKAIYCANGHISKAIADLCEQMKQASSVLDFEIARLRKKQIEQLEALLRPDFSWTGRLGDVRILHIDQGDKIAPEGQKKKVQQYHIWLIDSMGVRLLGAFADHNAAEVKQILKRADQPADYYPYALSRQEHLCTIGWFLYRKNRPGLWLNAAQSLPPVETIFNELTSKEATADNLK